MSTAGLQPQTIADLALPALGTGQGFEVEGRCMARKTKKERGVRELPSGKDGKPRFEAEWFFEGRIRRRFPTKTLALECRTAVTGQIVEGRYYDR
jgi:hypothetical protein